MIRQPASPASRRLRAWTSPGRSGARTPSRSTSRTISSRSQPRCTQLAAIAAIWSRTPDSSISPCGPPVTYPITRNASRCSGLAGALPVLPLLPLLPVWPVVSGAGRGAAGIITELFMVPPFVFGSRAGVTRPRSAPSSAETSSRGSASASISAGSTSSSCPGAAACETDAPSPVGPFCAAWSTVPPRGRRALANRPVSRAGRWLRASRVSDRRVAAASSCRAVWRPTTPSAAIPTER